MFILNILPILILLFYRNASAYVLLTYLYIYLYIYNYILNIGSVVDINIVIIFLNKLNSALYNPIIFLLICMLSNLFFYKMQSLNFFRNLLIINIVTFLTNTNSSISNLILVYKEDIKLASTLTNGLLIIHPLILYSYYSMLLLFLFTTIYREVNPLKGVYFFPFFLGQLPFYKIGFFALLLGSWWSHQELNWGGFWSWDLVEIFLLVVVIYNISLIHKDKLNTLYFYKLLFFLLNFILYAASVRYNLINSIHNFFTQDRILCNITYTILIFLLITVILLSHFCKTRKIFKVTKIWNYSIGLIEVIYMTLLLYVILVYTYFYLLKSSSIMLLHLVPTIIYTLMGSLIAYKLPITQLFLPLLESLFLSSFLFLKKLKLSYIAVIHVLILVFFLYTLIFYNINILLPILEVKRFMLSISVSSLTYLSNSGIWFYGLSSTRPFMAIINFNLFLENHLSSLRSSALGFVTYSVPLISELCGFTIFLHKLFIKISFVDNLAMLVFLVGLVSYFNFNKSYYPIFNENHY